MAEQHTRALQYRRGEFDTLDYAILEVIAVDMGRNGAPARTSYRTIADRAGCHYNTVSSRVQGLVEIGVLTAERDGKYMQYQIVFESVPDPRQIDPAEPAATAVKDETTERLDTLESKVDATNERLDRVIDELQSLQEILSQTLSHIVTTQGEGDVTEVREGTSPPTPPSNGNHADLQDGEDGIRELAEYFCQIAGKKLPRRFDSDYAEKFWWRPLIYIYDQNKQDRQETKRAMYGAVQYANEVGLTIATPKSLRNLATAGTRDKTGYRNQNGVLTVSSR